MQKGWTIGAALFILAAASATSTSFSVSAQQPARVAKSETTTPLPTFRRPGAVGLAEMMAQPPSYSYGSSINVFVYEDERRQIREVHVLGHADSDTCRKASSLVATAIVEKGYDTRDLFVAGAGRVVYDPAENVAMLRGLPQVQQYLQARGRLLRAETAVDTAAEGSHAELEQARRSVATLELDPNVRAFSMSLRGSAAMRDLVSGMRELAASSGLVTVHVVRYSIKQAIDRRISAAVQAGAAAVVRFDDLAADLPSGAEAAAIFPVMSLRNGQSVSASLGSALTTQQRFERASEVNKNELENVMVGDARARLSRQIEQRDQQRKSLEECKVASSEYLDAPITLNMECTDDGCFPSSNPTTISRRNYCQFVLPENQRRLAERISETREQIARIEADRRSAVSALAAMNIESLVDSMLRDWELPVGRTQAAFSAWRVGERPRSWAAFQTSMSAEAHDPEAIVTETTVFQVARQGSLLSVRPNQVIDIRRSVLIIDPRLGVTKSLDTWSERKSAPTSVAPSIESVVGAPGAIPIAPLLRAIEQTPLIAVTSASRTFGSTLADTQNAAAQSRTKARTVVAWIEFNEQRQMIESSVPEEGSDRDKLIAFLQQLKELNRLYQGYAATPTEYELSLARDAAFVVLKALGVSNPSDAQAFAFANRTADAQNSGGELERMNVLIAQFGFDARTIMRRAIASARRSDPDFARQVLSTREFPPEPSAPMRAVQQELDRGLRLEELEAIAALRTERSIMTEGLLSQAVDQILSEPALFTNAARSIDQASQLSSGISVGGARSARERLREWIRGQRPAATLSRLEVASLLQNTSSQIFRRNSFMAGEQLETIWAYRSNAELAARARFEAGDYARAVALLFPDRLPLAIAEPGITLAVENESETGPIESMVVELLPGGQMSVHAEKGGQRFAVLRIGGLTGVRSEQIAQTIRSQPVDQWRPDYPLVDQLRHLRVPLSEEQRRVYTALTNPVVRLALLKAMVYGCSLPAVEVVPLSGRCRTDARRSRLDLIAPSASQSSVALTLQELVEMAELKIASDTRTNPIPN
jgi:hypothetical protein